MTNSVGSFGKPPRERPVKDASSRNSNQALRQLDTAVPPRLVPRTQLWSATPVTRSVAAEAQLYLPLPSRDSEGSGVPQLEGNHG